MISLLVATAFADPCAKPTTAVEMVAAIGAAELAFIDIDLVRFETARASAETALDCLGEVLYPPDAAQWHRLEAMAAFVHKDDAASIAAYRASFALQPDYQLPDRIAPNGHPLRSWFDAARVLPATASNPLPTGVALYVDGTRAATYPSDRPFVLQAMDPSGRVQATAAIVANGALPAWASTGAATVTAPVTPPVTTTPTATYGSASITSFPAGSTFVVRDLHPDDAYTSNKSTIIGLSCVAGADMTRTDGAWWGGSATCNGNSFYFYKVAFDVTSTAAVAAPVSSATYGSATAPAALAQGTALTVREIAPDDGYYAMRAPMIGLSCTVGSSGMTRTDGAWFGGDVNCNDGNYYYFYKMAFDLASADSYPAGTAVTIRDVAPDDAYYPSRDAIIGQSCTVASDLHRQDGDWYGGDVNCSNGSYYYFYKAQITATGGGAPAADRYLGYAVPKSAWVTVVDVSSADAFAAYKGAIVGQTCQVQKPGLTGAGDGWFSGELKCGKTKLYFYQVAVAY